MGADAQNEGGILSVFRLLAGAETNMNVAGTSVGLLIGVIGGTVFLLLLRTADLRKTVAEMVTLTGEILAVPAFMGGGTWAGTSLLKSSISADFLNPYLIAMSLSFFLFCGYPAFRWVRRLADELGTARAKS
jgi:hypothetical protein